VRVVACREYGIPKAGGRVGEVVVLDGGFETVVVGEDLERGLGYVAAWVLPTEVRGFG
jgi:hypothetical protein